MKTYILKFRWGDCKFSCRLRAYSFHAAIDISRKIVIGLLGGRIISIAECPLQGV